MNKKQIFIGLGILAVAVVGVCIYKRMNKKEEEKSNFKEGDRIGKDCYCNGAWGPDCCVPKGSTGETIINGVRYSRSK